jgi:hypothetical protein
MKLKPNDEALILRGRRLIPDENSDDYFQYCAALIRMDNGTSVFDIVRGAVKLFGDVRQSRLTEH